MSLGTAIAELQSRFDQLARSKGGNPATYGTQGGKGQQPKRKNNPAHVAGAIAVLKALNKEVALPMQVLSRGAEVRAYLSISTENERLPSRPIYLSLETACASPCGVDEMAAAEALRDLQTVGLQWPSARRRAQAVGHRLERLELPHSPPRKRRLPARQT